MAMSIPGTDTTRRLGAHHLRELAASAISLEVIAARGYLSVTDPQSLPIAFAGYQRRPGLLIPIGDVTGTLASWQLKPDEPRTSAETGKPIKYETAAGGRTCLDVPAKVRPLLRNAEIPLWITEGAKKVDSGLSNGVACIIGLSGVDGWSSQGMALPDWKEIALRRRRVVLAFDSDVMAKASVRGALERLFRYLDMHAADVRSVVMPDLPDGSKCGLDDWFATGGTVLGLEAHTVDVVPGSVMDWEPPLPLDPTTGPPFPIATLPGAVGAYVAAVAEETQTPPDLPALVALGTLSAAGGGKYVVHVPSSNWTEPVHAMFLAVAEPGNRKSGIFQHVTAPLGEWEREKQQEEAPAIAQWESRARVLEKQLAAAESGQGKPVKNGKLTVSDAQRMEAVETLHEHLSARPVQTMVFTDDATPEAVKEQLIAQGGALAVMSAESAFLSNVAGRYSNAPHLDTILNGHAGDEIKVTRRGKPTERTERACLTLCLMVQPQVIEALGQVEGFRDRGGAARLLPAFPVDLIGRRRITTPAVPAALAAAWRDTVRAVLDTPRTGTPRVLHLDPAASEAFDAYREALEPTLQSEGRDMRGWSGKLAGTVLRIAALVHIAQHATPERVAIDAATIGQAIAIGAFFRDHARIMYRMMHGRNGQSEAGVILGVLRTVEGDRVSKRDLYQRVKRRTDFRNVQALDAALDVLEEYSWIRRERQSSPTGGRPSETILLAPALRPEEQADRGGLAGGGDQMPRLPEPHNVTPLRTGTDDGWSMRI